MSSLSSRCIQAMAVKCALLLLSVFYINTATAWTPPLPVNNDSTTDTRADRTPCIATDKNGVWVVMWADATTGKAMYARSADRGATWTDPVGFTGGPSGYAQRPAIATDNAGVWIAVWEAGTNGIVMTRSADNGISWSTPALVSDNSVAQWNVRPQIATDGAGNWTLVYEGGIVTGGSPSNYADVFYRHSSDGGVTWSSIALLNSTAGDLVHDGFAHVAASTSGVWIAAWVANGTYPMYARSTDSGATWSAAVKLSTSDQSRFNCDIKTDNNGVWVGVWGGIWYSRSADNGLTWSTLTQDGYSSILNSSQALDTDRAGTWIIAAENGNFSKSTDNGQTWSGFGALGDATEQAIVADGPGRFVRVFLRMTSDLDVFYSTATTTSGLEISQIISSISFSPDPAIVRAPLVVTATVKNTGPDAATNVELTDTITPAGLPFENIQLSQGTETTYNNTVFANLGTLPAGSAATVAVTVTPRDPNQIACWVNAFADQPDPDINNNMVGASVPVGAAEADLSVAVTDSPDPVMVGGNLRYSVTVMNHGPSSAEGVMVDELLDSTVAFAAASVSTGTLSQSADMVVADIGALPVGAIVTMLVDVTPLTSGVVVTDLGVFSSDTDKDPGDNHASQATLVLEPRVPVNQPDLILNKTVEQSQVKPGEQLVYHVTVTNSGQGTASDVAIEDDLPPQVQFSSAEISAGTVSQTGGVVTAQVGALAPGASVSLVIRTLASQTGTVLNTAWASSSSAESNSGNNFGSAQAQIVTAPPSNGPDLAGTWNNVRAVTRRAGTRLRGGLAVKNQGDQSASASFVQIYLSDDDQFSPDTDTLVKTLPVPIMRSGRTVTKTFAVRLPSGMLTSGRHAIAVLDATGALTEKDETNNVLVSQALP